MTEPLKSPFPAFGGKSQIADVVWERLGEVRNYIEPFAFSAAMLLRRPVVGAIETINDLNCFVSNFWRAIKYAPGEVAEHADWPVNEADLHARHRWLVNSADAREKLQRVREEPDYFDARIAGWWCWGACCWIGSGWCEDQQLPHMTAGQGVHRTLTQQLPHMDGGARGAVQMSGEISEKRPGIGNSRGVHNQMPSDTNRPQLADAFSRGRGVNGHDRAGTCLERRLWLEDWFGRLADRMRPVRICCGHWARVCDSDSTLIRLGTTGVFLDPPYRKTIDGVENRAADLYANDASQDIDGICDEVQAWCLKWGDNPEIRIVLCGLDGEYPALEAAGWEVVAWKSRGGYGNRTDRGKENAARERLWISPHCISATLGGLFAKESA